MAKKRADRVGRAWLDTARAYSSLEKSATARARGVRAMPWGDVAGETDAFNASWRAVRDLVERFAADPASVVDPTPSATQYGGMKIDADLARAEKNLKSGKWKRVRPVVAARLVNAFFSEVRAR